MSVRYEAQYARIVDAFGKPLGTDAALMLSQMAWLCAESGQSDADGWVQWTYEECEAQMALTRRQQQRIVPILEGMGILNTYRRGVDGRRNVQIDMRRLADLSDSTFRADPTHRSARNVLTEPVDGKHQTCEPDAGKNPYKGAETPLHGGENPATAIYRNARQKINREINREIRDKNTEDPPTPTSGGADEKTNRDEWASFAVQVKARRTSETDLDWKAKLLLAAFRMVRYVGEPFFTRSDFSAYRTNLRTLVEDGYVPQQIAEATRRALSQFEKREMVNPRSMARNISSLLEAPERQGALPLPDAEMPHEIWQPAAGSAETNAPKKWDPRRKSTRADCSDPAYIEYLGDIAERTLRQMSESNPLFLHEGGE